MDNLLNKLKQTNDEQIKIMCERKLKEVFEKDLEVKIKNKAYETAGGYRKFQRDMDRLKQEFDSELRDFKEYEVKININIILRRVCLYPLSLNVKFMS
jgi:hypothetical protein